MRMLTANVLLLGHPHVPGAVTPEFLREREIIPAALELDREAPNVADQASAQLYFRGDWRVVVLPDRLHVFKDATASDADLTILAGIVSAYAQALPGIHHSAIGTNFGALVPQHLPARWIRDRFLRSDEVLGEAVCTGLQLRYNAAGTPLNVSFRETPSAPGSPPAMAFDANMHRNLAGPDLVGAIAECTARIVSDANYVDALLSALLAPERV